MNIANRLCPNRGINIDTARHSNSTEIVQAVSKGRVGNPYYRSVHVPNY